MRKSNQRESMAVGARTTTERRSAWDGGVPALDVAALSRDFYGDIPLAVRGGMDVGRNQVRAVPALARELTAMRRAGATESTGRRLVATGDRMVSELWAVPVRGWDALKPAECHVDAHEDIAECEVDLARKEYERDPSVGPTRYLNALDTLRAKDSETLGVVNERITWCAREKARLTEGQ